VAMAKVVVALGPLLGEPAQTMGPKESTFRLAPCWAIRAVDLQSATKDFMKLTISEGGTVGGRRRPSRAACVLDWTLIQR
jgi:hypothetical protein